MKTAKDINRQQQVRLLDIYVRPAADNEEQFSANMALLQNEANEIDETLSMARYAQKNWLVGQKCITTWKSSVRVGVCCVSQLTRM
jgi:hypothetical protein